MEVMTDLQFTAIIEMVDIILESCEDIQEAREKVKRIIKQQKDREKTE